MDQLRLSERIAEFLSWTSEEREVCLNIHLAMKDNMASLKQEKELPVYGAKVQSRTSKRKPDRHKDQWTQEDDLEIICCVEQHGLTAKAWRKLSKLLHRTPAAVATRYYNHIRKKDTNN